METKPDRPNPRPKHANTQKSSAYRQQHNRSPRRAVASRRLHPIAALAVDAVVFTAALLIYALFHHVLPAQRVEAIRSVSNLPHAAATVDPLSEPIPTPGIVEYEGFPDYDTGIGALFSHQSDTLRIAVTQQRVNDANCYIADIWVRDIRQLRTSFSEGEEFRRGTRYSAMPQEIAEGLSAVLVTSGDYASARSEGLVIRNGMLYRDSIVEDVCLLYDDGVMETFHRNAFSMDIVNDRNVWQAWSFGPKLLEQGGMPDHYDGAEQSLQDILGNRDPRAAIGYYEPGHYCLVVADGRQEHTEGLSIRELSQLFIDLGCADAYNLDGGQTASMLFSGTQVNEPYKGGREIGDIIYLTEEIA